MNRFPLVRAWFEANTPLEPQLLAAPAFDDSIAARVRELNLRGDGEFAERLAHDPREARRAVSMVAVQETWLFRGLASFEFLRTRLVTRAADGGEVRLLSAGCANGAEPCSLAATALAAGVAADALSIDAVDIHLDAFHESQGRFTGMSRREPVPDWAAPWIRVGADAVTAHADVVRCIHAIHADILIWSPPPTARAYDAILCRNLLIYLSREARTRLVARLARWLAPDGILVAGHADAVDAAAVSLSPVGPVAAFAFARATPTSPPPPSLDRPKVAPVRGAPPVAEPRATRPTPTFRPTPTVASCLALLRDGKSDAAVEQLGTLLRNRPDDVEALRAMAAAQRVRGNLGAAEETLRKIVYLAPRDEGALLELADVAARDGRQELAERYRARAIEAHLANEEEPRRT